jgi:hypothetical protein
MAQIVHSWVLKGHTIVWWPYLQCLGTDGVLKIGHTMTPMSREEISVWVG